MHRLSASVGPKHAIVRWLLLTCNTTAGRLQTPTTGAYNIRPVVRGKPASAPPMKSLTRRSETTPFRARRIITVRRPRRRSINDYLRYFPHCPRSRDLPQSRSPIPPEYPMTISDSIAMSINLLKIGAATFIASLAIVSSASASTEVTRSPKGDKSIVITYGHEASATYRSAGRQLSIVRDLPLNGVLSVDWLNDEVAHVHGSCGTECSINFFASPKGVIGPYPSVVEVDVKSGVFIDYEYPQSAIKVYSLTWPTKVLGQAKAPSWCAHLECDFSNQLQPGVFTLSSGNHRLAIRYRER